MSFELDFVCNFVLLMFQQKIKVITIIVVFG